MEHRQRNTAFIMTFKTEAIQEVASNPSLVKVVALRMQANGE